MKGCKSLSTLGVKEVTSTSESARFEQQLEEDDEDLNESDDEEEEGPRETRGDFVPAPGAAREFSREEIRNYRSAVARCNYLASDRFEIAFATEELCRGMANPTEEGLQTVKRLIRFLSLS